MVQHCLQDKAVEKARCLARAAQPQSGIGGGGCDGQWCYLGPGTLQVHRLRGIQVGEKVPVLEWHGVGSGGPRVVVVIAVVLVLVLVHATAANAEREARERQVATGCKNVLERATKYSVQYNLRITLVPSHAHGNQETERVNA